MTRFPRPHGWLQWVAVTAAVFVVAVGIAAVVILTGKPGDVSHPNVEFTAPTATTDSQPAPKAKKKAAPQPIDWRYYGFDRQRTRYLPLAKPLHPPYREVWNYSAGSLLEFPPVLFKRTLYVLKDDGMLVAHSTTANRVFWRRKLGYLAASSPAVGDGSVYAVVLQRFSSARRGRIVALDGRTGRVRWARELGARAESSPLLQQGVVYFGSEDGTVYALRAADGSVKWTYHADGAVKGGLAMDYRGRLFFGDYAGKVYSLDASNGGQIWKKTTSGAHYGLSSGQFYATPAVAYGRVYMGNTDGFVYSYASSSGNLAWRTQTSAYVYGSAAVGQVPGGRPAVYVGSYDGSFYALDAQSGRRLWVANAHGRVSGGAVLIGDLVWFSTLEQSSRALNARNGRLVYQSPRGQFNPVISDGLRIYLVGHSSITALEPYSRAAAAQARRKRAAARRAAAARRRAAARRPRTRRVCRKANGRRRCRVVRVR